MLTELLPQDSILLSQILDDLQLSLIHPPGNGHEQERPRVSRLIALALRFQDLLSHGSVRKHAQLAVLGHVSRVRVCQILLLNNLAPAIQEALLFLPKTVRGRDRITERSLRRMAKLVDWDAQIQLFRRWLAAS